MRRENVELRLRAKDVQSESEGLQRQNAELQQRIDEAHRRVAALLEKFPALPSSPQDKELA